MRTVELTDREIETLVWLLDEQIEQRAIRPGAVPWAEVPAEARKDINEERGHLDELRDKLTSHPYGESAAP